MLCFWCRGYVHAGLRSLDALVQSHTPRLSKVRGSVNNLQPVQGPGSGTQTAATCHLLSYAPQVCSFKVCPFPLNIS